MISSKLKNIMKKIFLLLFILTSNILLQAQISITGTGLAYTQDFNTLLNSGTTNAMNIPGWSIFRLGGTATNQAIYVASSGTSNPGGVHSVGVASIAERALGSLGTSSANPIYYGARFTNNTGVNINSMRITYKQEQWRVGDTVADNSDTVHFFYSVNATDVNDTTSSAIWIEVPALMMTSLSTVAPVQSGVAINGDSLFAIKTALIFLSLPNSGDVVIRWKDMNSAGSDDLNAVDSLTAVFTTASTPPSANRPNIIIVSPPDNATGIAAVNTSLVMSFSRKVTKGTVGNIIVVNETDQTLITKAVTSADVTLNSTGDTAFVANVLLVADNAYHVLVDSIAFDSAGYKVIGIDDTTSWNFGTQGTIVTLNGLSESFEANCPASLPWGWSQYSVSGSSQFWHCNAVAADYGLVMSSGSLQSTTLNEDWLITPRIDPANLTNIMLAFKTKFRYAGPNMEVKFSIAYTGGGNPNQGIWSTLAGINFSSADSNIWVAKSAPIIASVPFFIAFKYSSTQATPGNGREWNIDSVFITGVPTSINTVSGSSGIPLAVLGHATNSRITIAFDLAKDAEMQVGIYDLAGREVYAEKVRAVKGNNRISLMQQSLQAGMYIIRIGNGNEQGVARTWIQ